MPDVSLSDHIIPAVYVIGMVLAYYPIAHAIVYSAERPDGADWGFGVTLGAILSLFWPALLAAFCVFMVSKRLWTGRWSVPWRKSIRDKAKVS